MINYETPAGHSIYIAAQEATELAKSENSDVKFQFNQIVLITTPRSNPDDIAVIYSLKSEIRRLKAGNFNNYR